MIKSKLVIPLITTLFIHPYWEKTMPYQVKNFMSNPYAYVTVDDTLDRAIEKMSRLNTQKITVTDEENFIYAIIAKSDLYKFIGSKADSKKFRNVKIKDVIDENKYSVIVYPQNDLSSAISIMKDMEINYLPVGESPWEKKLIGFVSADDVQSVISKNIVTA